MRSKRLLHGGPIVIQILHNDTLVTFFFLLSSVNLITIFIDFFLVEFKKKFIFDFFFFLIKSKILLLIFFLSGFEPGT